MVTTQIGKRASCTHLPKGRLPANGIGADRQKAALLFFQIHADYAASGNNDMGFKELL